MPTEMTKTERGILLTNVRILQCLSSNNSLADEVRRHLSTPEEYDQMAKALECGYVLEYDNILSNLGIYNDPEVSYEDCRLTLDILTMYSVLQSQYKRMDDNLKTDELQRKVAFPGFDNHEYPYLFYARYYINTLGRFKDLEQHKHDMDSHCNIIDNYKRMLPVYNEALSLGSNRCLSDEAVIKLLEMAPTSM